MEIVIVIVIVIVIIIVIVAVIVTVIVVVLGGAGIRSHRRRLDASYNGGRCMSDE